MEDGLSCTTAGYDDGGMGIDGAYFALHTVEVDLFHEGVGLDGICFYSYLCTHEERFW